MVDHAPLEDHTSQGSRAYSIASDIIQAAFTDATRIRLEAVRAAEQTYEEIVRSAQARADSILADAREEARRITTEAEKSAARRATFDSAVSEAALELLRSELAAMVRQLWGSSDGGNVSAPGRNGGLGAATQARSTSDKAVRPTEAPPESNGTTGHPSPPPPPRNGSLDEHGNAERRHPELDGSWRPPDWMSS